MWQLLDLIILKLKGYKTIGHIRYKNESLAPKEWKRSLWDKIKNNDLFNPINIESEEHKKEFKIFIQGKVVIIAINFFLISFLHSFLTQTIIICKSEYNIYNISKINFKNQIPKEIKNIQDINLIENKLKDDFQQNQINNLKSQALPFANSLLVIYMILKHYTKNRKTKNKERI